MLTAQYSMTLPTDYDMDIIRRRVLENGAKMDGYPGLGLKAYLIQEKGIRGSNVNVYAPFYRWADADGAARFFFGGQGFGGIVRDFGRPIVKTWIEGSCQTGAVDGALFATKTIATIPRNTDPAVAASAAEAAFESLRETDGVLLSLFGIDLENWETLHFALWSREPEQTHGEIYEVLHVSVGPDAA